MMSEEIRTRFAVAACVALMTGVLASCRDGSSPPSVAGTAADTVTIVWQAPTENTDGSALSNLGGYKIYYGETSGEYSSSIDIPNPGLTSYVVQNLPAGQYYFTMTSYNSAGLESAFSPEVSATLN